MLCFGVLQSATTKLIGNQRFQAGIIPCRTILSDAEPYYELCALSELKNALRSGNIWVQGSRQFKGFEDYLLPPYF